MIKIMVHDNPDTIDPDFSENFTVDASFTSNEDSAVDDILKMIVKAMEIEGYMRTSIVRSFREMADDIADSIDLDAALTNQKDEEDPVKNDLTNQE